MSDLLSIKLAPPWNDAHVVLLAGELDLASSCELEHFLDRLSGKVILDCRALTFIDVVSTHMLDRVAAKLDDLRLVDVTAPVARVLELTNTSYLLGCNGKTDT